MEPINFIKTISAHEYRAIKRWYGFSLGMLSIAFIGILSIQTMQCWHLYTAYTTYKTARKNGAKYHTIIADYEQVKNKTAMLQQQVDTLHMLNNNAVVMASCLTELLHISDSTFLLENCVMTPSTVTLTLLTHLGTTIIRHIKTFNAMDHLSDMMLYEVQPHNNQMRIILKGEIRSKK